MDLVVTRRNRIIKFTDSHILLNIWTSTIDKIDFGV